MKKRTTAAATVLEDNAVAILEMHRRGVNATAIAKIYGVTAPTVRTFLAAKTGENNEKVLM